MRLWITKWTFNKNNTKATGSCNLKSTTTWVQQTFLHLIGKSFWKMKPVTTTLCPISRLDVMSFKYFTASNHKTRILSRFHLLLTHFTVSHLKNAMYRKWHHIWSQSWTEWTCRFYCVLKWSQGGVRKNVSMLKFEKQNFQSFIIVSSISWYFWLKRFINCQQNCQQKKHQNFSTWSCQKTSKISWYFIIVANQKCY